MSTPNIQSHCNTCGGEREHVVLHEESKQWSDEQWEVSGATAYQMLKCAGCGTFSMRREDWNSEFTDEYGRPEASISYFPPRLFRKLPTWHSDLQTYRSGESTISELLQEIYVALQNDLRRLAAMGIRALLEHMMIDKVGDNKSFQKNISEFHKQGFISDKQKEFLETVLEAGHASIHRDFKPDVKTLISVMDIAESIVQSTYIHEQQSSEIKAKIPQKKK